MAKAKINQAKAKSGVAKWQKMAYENTMAACGLSQRNEK
jgi:hypothetical protein